MSLSGGVPRQILEGVEWADWGPDGKTLAVVRRVETGDRLEYPVGKTIFRSTGWVGRPRFSPSGDRIALEDHPYFAGDSGEVVAIDLAGKVLARSNRWNSLEGLCWSADGSEVWFTAIQTGGNPAPLGDEPVGARERSPAGPRDSHGP